MKTKMSNTIFSLIDTSRTFFQSLLIGSVEMVYAGKTSKVILHFESKDSSGEEYLSVAQMSERYPAFSQGSLRWLIFNGEINGFKKVIRKIGRKVVLSLSEFRRFIEEQAPK